MADESIRSEPASLAKAAAQDDQEDRAAPPALALGLRVIDVPAPVPATVNSANESFLTFWTQFRKGVRYRFPPTNSRSCFRQTRLPVLLRRPTPG
jgi:hypothetical protein